MSQPTAMACCLAGTLVNTPIGPIPIEALVVGEPVLFAAGGTAHVSAVERLSMPGPVSLDSALPLPILIRAGSAGRGMPRRDVFVFPDSEMLRNGDIAQLGRAVDQRSILQFAGADRVDYVCAAFDGAGFPLAEGAAIRCTLTMEDVARLRRTLQSGGQPRSKTNQFRPVADGIVAKLETCSREGVGGVAFALSDLTKPVMLQLVVDGIVAGSTQRSPRFQMDLPSIMRPGPYNVIQVRLADGGVDIAGSPFLLSGTSWPPARGASVTVQAQAASDFDGLLGVVQRRRIEGFAWTTSKPQTPETILIVDNGQVIATVLANLKRPDLLASRIGDGRHGFELDMSPGLSPLESHTIQILRASDGAGLPGGPKTIPASNAFADLATKAVAEAVEAIATTSELNRALAFMTAQTSRLLQRRADLIGGREAKAAFASFTRRWGPSPEGARLQPIVKPPTRVLIIVNSLPRASSPYLSSQLRSHAEALVSLGCDVDIVATEDIADMPPLSAQMRMSGVTICESPYYASAEEVLRRHAGDLELVYVLAAEAAAFYVRLARRLNPRAKIVYSPGHFTYRELAERGRIECRPDLSRLAASRRFDELSAAAASDIVLTSSASDHALAGKELPNAVVKRVPFCVPRRASGPRMQRAGVALLAGRGDALDFDSVHYLAEQIMPALWQTQPDVDCTLVFSDVPGWAAGLTRERLTIERLASAEDSRILARVALTIAPYRFYAGLSAAILESFAAGVPCLMTPVACEGFDLPAGLQPLVCRNASEFANRASSLTDREVYDKIVAEMSALMAHSFHAEASRSTLREEILKNVKSL